MHRAREIIEAFQHKKTERATLSQLWEEVAGVLAPERVGFVGQPLSARRTERIFDTVPITAKRGLVNAIGSMLRPKSSAPGKWFDIVPENEDLLEERDVKEWIEFAEERLWKALYNPKAKFIQATGEVDDDLITFGTGAGYLALRPDQVGLAFRSFHLANVYLITNAENDAVGVHIFERMTARQAAQRWGEDNLGAKTREALNDTNTRREEKFDFIWCVKERHAYDQRRQNRVNMPYLSLVVDVASESEVLEEGYEEFPFFLPRWDTRSGEIYGRGPGIMALPDVLTLNQMGKTMLRGLHRAVDPPWLLPSDGMVNAPQMRPGGVSYYDAKAIRNLGMSKPFMQMDSKANIPWGLSAQSAAREQIHALFYRNVLNLPVDAPQMTATEVIQRREEFVREIGAVFGRLESDYTGPLVERAFNIMLRRGAFGDITQIPEALQGESIQFRFASPVEKAKRQIEEATVVQGIEKVIAIGQVQPSVMDPYDWVEIGKFIAESNDFPSALTLDEAGIEDKQKAQAQAQQQEQMMQTMERGAGIVSQLPEGVMEEEAA